MGVRIGVFAVDPASAPPPSDLIPPPVRKPPVAVLRQGTVPVHVLAVPDNLPPARPRAGEEGRRELDERRGLGTAGGPVDALPLLLLLTPLVLVFAAESRPVRAGDDTETADLRPVAGDEGRLTLPTPLRRPLPAPVSSAEGHAAAEPLGEAARVPVLLRRFRAPGDELLR